MDKRVVNRRRSDVLWMRVQPIIAYLILASALAVGLYWQRQAIEQHAAQLNRDICKRGTTTLGISEAQREDAIGNRHILSTLKDVEEQVGLDTHRVDRALAEIEVPRGPTREEVADVQRVCELANLEGPEDD